MKIKAHRTYELPDGTKVPGVTTILGLLAKPWLLEWVWRQGLKGNDYKKIRDQAAEMGTLTHEMIVAYFQGKEPDTKNYTKVQIDKAENALISFFEWEKRHSIEPIYIEKPLVSEKYKYGGTIDLLCYLDGTRTLVDFKTSKSIYDDQLYQVAAYAKLISENGHTPEDIFVVRIGRDETEGFEVRSIKNTEQLFQVFESLLQVYYAKKNLKRGL